MVSPLLSAGAALATRFIPNFKVWNLVNLDTNEVLQGQFEAQGVTEDISVEWAEFTSLNRQKPIMQFLHGNADNVSFTGRFFSNHALDTDPEQRLNLLKSWTKIESTLRRPPICQFWVGDGHLRINCIIAGITGITYGRPDFFGRLRDVSFGLSLKEFSTFSIDDTEETNTRFARAQDRSYYELLAFEEYGNPMVGDVIRKDHPDQQSLKPGDVVKLPSIEGIRSKQVTQTSIPLKTGFGRKDTAQKRLRLAFFDSRSESFVSHILQPSTTPDT